MNKIDIDRLVTVGEAARMLGKSSDMVKVYERDGKLPAVRIAGIRFFRREDVTQLATEQTAGKRATAQ